MPAPRLPNLNVRVIAATLLVAIPVLLIGAALVIGTGQKRLEDAEKVRLGQMAVYTASSVDAYLYRHILDIALLGRVPDLRRAAAAGNGQADEPQRTAQLDREWQKDSAAVAARLGVLNSPASQFLADLVKNDSTYREVLVTDRYGRLVAASSVTSDYFQADEDWWKRAFDSGRGRISVSDVSRDESANVYAFEIAVPVLNPQGNDVVGIMKVVADSREMLVDIAGLELGSTGEAMLVRPDGSIVFSRRPYRQGDRFFGSGLLTQILDERSRRKEPPGTFTYEAQAEDRRLRIIAVAPSQLARSYPQLAWMTVVSMDKDELRGPFRSLIWYLLLVIALTAVAVLALALWLSLRLAAPSIDPTIDMHLVEHAPVRGFDEERVPEDRLHH
jgi:two-component system, NtrC family, sensor kinase